ncbi:MAG: DUF4124 domain-containing protein [Burkholderiales bacterium]|nr:DUF4124 domain-containing protein [Burkholderiales bacterium]MDE2628245.1 DUF4124 domain-containing protein [Burkholderiales bacterium]
MARWNVVVLAALLGLTFAMPASAQWKWRDKSGQTQYSDLAPPAGTPDRDILQRPGANALRGAPSPAVPASAASGTPALTPKSADPELEARRKKAEQEAADKKKAEDAKIAAARAENCSRAQAQLRTIDSGMRMARINAKGERVFLDEAARAAEAQRTREVIASECR